MAPRAGIDEHSIVSWRNYRTLSVKQRIALDFCTNQGYFANKPRKQPMCLYGGAGWGGKSYLLRSASYEFNLLYRELGFPNQWGTLYCLTYPDLQDRHIRKIQREFAGIGRFSESNKHGYHIEFYEEGLGGVYLRNIVSSGDSSKNQNTKRGSESVYGLIDELTELTYDQFGNILYTIRPDDKPLPFIPILAATNPDGVGHGWVKKVFHPHYRNLEHAFFRAYSPENLFFVQALKSDNPAYAVHKEIIDARMGMVEDPDIRRARDEGAWDLYASGRFYMWRDAYHRFVWANLFERWGITDVSPEEFLKNCEDYGFVCYASLDYATSHDSVSAYLLHLVDPDGNVWTFYGLGMVGKEAEEQAKLILELERRCGLKVRRRFADPAINGKAAEDKSRLTRKEKFKRAGVHFELAINDRVEGAATVASFLLLNFNSEGSLTKHPRWRIHSGEPGWIGAKDLANEIPDLPRDKTNPEDVDPQGGRNHWYDSGRYFLHTRFRGIPQPKNDAYEFGSPEYLRRLRDAQKQRDNHSEDWL